MCAMLNREGGDILLGVDNNGVVTGIDPTAIATMKTNMVTLSNNPQKLDPPFILFPFEYKINNKQILHIQVSASSQVHRTAGIIFDRSDDGDFRVTEPHRIAEIFNRKRLLYTENTIYPALKFKDFKPGLFPKVRALIRSNNPAHPWLGLSDENMLKMAGLWQRNLQTGQEGYTLAAALLFGKDEVIHSIIPHYKTDALVRINDLSRYDDRDYIDTNLIEAYDRLMDFIAKHLPDKFYMEGDQRKSLRTNIFREIVANILVHREFTNAYPATFIIYKDRVETDNANNPHGHGPINPNSFAPFPKNPLIAKFFIQLGRVDELGSGILNVNKFLASYTPRKKAQFIEGNSFKSIVPIDEKLVDGKVSDRVNDIVSDRVNDIVNDIVSDSITDIVKKALAKVIMSVRGNPGLTTDSLASIVKKSIPTTARYIKVLKDNNIINFEGAPKTGGYHLTERVKKKLEVK